MSIHRNYQTNDRKYWMLVIGVLVFTASLWITALIILNQTV